ncbi:DUF637 domain-containing protein [Thalassospira sp. MA62]|nr:DUF637 domain-containing protein [Thalassospira sp. MA62]
MLHTKTTASHNALISKLKKGARGVFALMLSFNISVLPTIANAQAIPDNSQAGTIPSLEVAPNGVPVVNIAPPSSKGVSHNRFSSLDIQSQGMIFNNSKNVGTSQLGGVLLGNPNLRNSNTANIILNEVTGTSQSQLKGFAEIFGDRAQFVIANPNGITCDGCGFINTSRTTLTTGTPSLLDGDLNQIDVNGSAPIRIEGAGLNAEDAQALHLLARTVQLNAPVNTDELKVFAGRNLMDYGAHTVTAKADDGTEKPALAIDASLYGAMYAGQIEVIATEEGVGVRMPDEMAAGNGDLSITADGRIEIKNASSSQSVKLNSHSSDINIAGNTNGGPTFEALADLGTVNIAEQATVGASEQVHIQGQNVENAGEVLAGLDSSGNVTQQGTLAVDATDTLTNTGILSSGNDIVFKAQSTVNDEGAILAYNNLTIEGQDGNAADSILNLSGAIETASGDITLRAETVENSKKVFETTSSLLFQQRYYESDGNPPRNPPGKGISSEGWAYMTDGRTVVVPHPDLGMAYAAYYDFGSITVAQYISEITEESASAIISSGNDLIIEGDTITNQYSALSATNDISLTGTSFDNVAATLSKDLYFTNHGGRYNRCLGGPCQWYEDGASTVLVERTSYDSINATVQAGGTITGDFTGQINNSTIAETVDDLEIERANKITKVGTETPDSGEVDLISLLDKIPGSGALVQAAPSDANYIFENRSQFTDTGTFFGSDYFLSKVDIDAEAVPTKAAFDSALETRLVRDAVWMETGNRWLDPAVQDASQQLKNLIDNAQEAQSGLDLQVGIALTSEQIDALQQDIIWYVTENIDGQDVLVPRLYLASANKAKLAPNHALIAANDIELSGISITNNSDIIATNNIELEGAENIVNSSGVIQAGNDVSVLTTGNVLNNTSTYNLSSAENELQSVRGRTGQITAGNDLSITALGDVVVQGADLESGNDTDIYGGGNVVIETVAMREKGAYDVGFHSEAWDKTKHIGSNVTAGGDISITAGDNIAISGTDITAGSNIDLQAENSIFISSVENSAFTEGHGDFSNKSWDSQSSLIKNKISNLTAGGSLTVNATDGDILIKASKLSSEDQTVLDASNGEVAMLSATDLDQYSYKSDASNAFWFKTQDTGHHHTNVVMTEVTADGGLIVNAGNGVVIEYRDTGNLDDSVTALAATPGLEWMGDMMARDDATWNAIKEVHKSWDYKAQGLSGAASAVIVIAISAVTAGAGGPAAMAGSAAAQAASAAGMSAAASAIGAAVTAGVSALTSQAAVSLINNRGDLGAVLKEMGSSSTLRSLVTSMVTAGITAGVTNNFGVDLGIDAELGDQVAYQSIRTMANTVASAAINGTDIGDTLKSNLLSSLVNVTSAQLATKIGDLAGKNEWNLEEGDIRKVIMHAVAGCGVGQLSSQNCAAGAIGAGLQEVLGDSLENFSDDISTRIQLAGLAGAIAVALTGGDADAVNTAAFTAQQAETYNRQLHTDELLAIEEKAKELAGTDGKSADEWHQLLQQEAMRLTDEQWDGQFDGTENTTVLNALAELRTEYGTDFVNKVGDQFRFLEQDSRFSDQLTFANSLVKHSESYNIALRGWSPYDGDLPASITPAQAALAFSVVSREGLSDEFFSSEEILERLDPSQTATEVSRGFALLQIRKELAATQTFANAEFQATKTAWQAAENVVDQRQDAVETLTEAYEDNPNAANLAALEAAKTELSEAEEQLGIAFNAHKVADQLRYDAEIGVKRAAIHTGDAVRRGAAAGVADALAEPFKDTAEGLVLLSMALNGDEASQTELDQTWKSIVWLANNPDQLPDTIADSLTASLNEAQAAFEAGDYSAAGEIAGNLQTKLLTAVSGVAVSAELKLVSTGLTRVRAGEKVRVSAWSGVDTRNKGIGADVPDDIAGWVKGPDGSSVSIRKNAQGLPDWENFLKDNAFVTNVSGSLNPSLIRFTQDSINARFSDGRSVDDLVAGLRNGSIDPSSLPPIRTFDVNGQLFSLDNRRLYAYQQAGLDVPTTPATAAEIARDSRFKFSTVNGGLDIAVRGR